MSLRFGLGLLLSLWLGGCAWWRSPPPAIDQGELAWLERIDRWQLQARLGVRGERESWHGGIDWVFHNGQDRLVLSGPFGQGGVVIQIDAGQIRIERAGGETQVSDRPEELLEAMLGVAVPVIAMHFWIRGLPAPGHKRIEYGSDGRIRRLLQQGWEVEYLEYRALGPYALPVKLILTGPRGVRLKLVVDQWRVGEESDRA